LVGDQPRFRRLARQPGLMASFASGLVMALFGLEVVVRVVAAIAFSDDGVSWQDIPALTAWLLDEEMVTRVARCGGFAVLVSWTTLLFSRQWHVEQSWVDRLGRAIGFCWILAAFAIASGNVLTETDYYTRYVHAHPESSLPAALDAVP
jgi:hypothetical protein